jgi:hypothetical protein
VAGAAHLRWEGKRQKAKMQRLDLSTARILEPPDRSLLLPFGFCLLPFAFVRSTLCLMIG